MKGDGKPPLAVVSEGAGEPMGDRVRRAMAELRWCAEHAPDYRTRRTSRRALAMIGMQRSVIHMKLYDERRDEIEADVEAAVARIPDDRAKVSAMLVLYVLLKAAKTITAKSQRMTVSQRDLALQMKLAPETVSRAFGVLASVGAVMAREARGKSVSWEIDAEYCSRMAETEREAEIERQWKAREAAKATALAKTAQGRLNLKVVPGGMDGVR